MLAEEPSFAALAVREDVDPAPKPAQLSPLVLICGALTLRLDGHQRRALPRLPTPWMRLHDFPFKPDAGVWLRHHHANSKVATFCAGLWPTFTLPLTRRLIWKSRN
ncbi:hypothetical protein [Yoonia sp.]|uniref:hypothetical protein n=1 Tax=Yoonia sp. TaxID=2212373 RepID=UPI003974B00C